MENSIVAAPGTDANSWETVERTFPTFALIRFGWSMARTIV